MNVWLGYADRTPGTSSGVPFLPRTILHGDDAMRKCKIENCDGKYLSRGWCGKHYERWRQHGDPNYKRKTPQQRFSDSYLVAHLTGCWIWLLVRNPEGYGLFRVNGKTVLAHRFSYEQKHGPIPDGLQSDHLCRVRSCVNPDHIEPVTPKVNTNRGVNHNKEKTHCLRGHVLSGKNLYIRPDGDRECKACHLMHCENYRLKKRERN